MAALLVIGEDEVESLVMANGDTAVVGLGQWRRVYDFVAVRSLTFLLYEVSALVGIKMF